MTTEAINTKVSFHELLNDAKQKKGKEVELVTFAQDTVSGLKRVYSNLGILGERDLNQSLSEFVQELVPEGENRETLEAAFENEPDRVEHPSHNDEVVSEWDTVLDKVKIGIKAIRDQRGESVRTWYLKSV